MFKAKNSLNLRIKQVLLAALVGAGLSGCGASEPVPDFKKVLERSIDVLVDIDQDMVNSGLDTVDDQDMLDLPRKMRRAMNAKPPIYVVGMGLMLRPDGALIGFRDDNRDGVLNGNDHQIFTLELDADNSRMIVTANNGFAMSHALGSFATNLFSNQLIARLLQRQIAAGHPPGYFDKRQTVVIKSSKYIDPEPPKEKTKDGEDSKKAKKKTS